MEEEKDHTLIEDVIRQRIEGIKLRKPEVIRDAVDVEMYSKFDDWPPGRRMQGEEALESERTALKVLSEYRYGIGDLLVKVKGDLAWASFYLHYDGVIRNRSFDVESRVSMVLARSGDRWRIVHEHFSMQPEVVPTLAAKPLEEKAGVSEEPKDELEEAIVKVLSDGVERTAAEISQEVSKSLGREVATSNVVEKCRELATRGVIERTGRFYPRYKIGRLHS